MPETSEEKKRKTEGRKELAKERTDWALYRTSLAKERTFNAWLRTGLTSLAAGVAVARLVTIETMPFLTKILGGLLIAAGGLFFAIALWRYRHGYQELREIMVEVLPLKVVSIIILLLLGGTVLSLLLIVFP